MKRLSLQVRITIICALILTGIAVLLTAVTVQNARTTYTNQFELYLGNDTSFQYNEDGFSYHGSGEELVNDILDFVNGYIKDGAIPSRSNESMIFGAAGRKFAKESLGYMLLLVAAGIILTYFLVRKALGPVRKLSQTVKEINEHNLYRKIEVPEAKDEIGSLAGSFNGMLERLNQSFTNQKNFAANVAHELRTPLSTMKAGIQVLEMDAEPSAADYKETIGIIKKSTGRMIEVVDDLLELSKNERVDFSNMVDLDRIFQEIKQDLSEKAKAMGVSIILEQCGGSIEGNGTLLYRALFNLMENAVKYNREGGYVSAGCETRDAMVKITISDNGTGISKEALEHIFEPFYRADRHRSREVRGSGLGLAIVKEIIEKHKGRIIVSSVEGEGTVFEILLWNRR
jgi:signal transduction histidine kinase